MTTRAISNQELQFYLVRGRRLRAEAVHDGIGALADRLADLAAFAGTLVGRVLRAYGRQRLRRQAVAQLSALSDYSLADIGVRREEIPFLVEDWLRSAGPEASVAVSPIAFPKPVSRARRERATDLAEAA